MATTRMVRVGLLLAVVLAALVGCSTPSGPSASSTVAGPTAAPAPTPPGPTSGAGSPASSTEAAPGTGKCVLSDLLPEVARTTGEAGQRHTTVVWTNISSSTCTMYGYGGVDLQGPPDPMGSTYSLPRQTEERPTTVRLTPGEKAHTSITWLPPQSGPGWTPRKLLITPPDETHAAVLDWPGDAVLRQDAATHPGTYLGPVQAGAGT